MGTDSAISDVDEALRSLADTFQRAPNSLAFVPLAEALLARGHAAEALKIADHGLQIHPRSADGRVHRASALVALGRARVAYVELRRALAIEPSHRRALRLLGRLYAEAGLPDRAARLLVRRPVDAMHSVDARGAGLPLPVNADTRPPETAPDLNVRASAPGRAASDIPELFRELTKDLGLADAESSVSPHVAVTQVVRARHVSSLGGKTELSTIEGPIVEATQPGHDSPDDAEATDTGPFSARTAPGHFEIGEGELDETVVDPFAPTWVEPLQPEEAVTALSVPHGFSEHSGEDETDHSLAMSPSPSRTAAPTDDDDTGDAFFARASAVSDRYGTQGITNKRLVLALGIAGILGFLGLVLYLVFRSGVS